MKKTNDPKILLWRLFVIFATLSACVLAQDCGKAIVSLFLPH